MRITDRSDRKDQRRGWIESTLAPLLLLFSSVATAELVVSAAQTTMLGTDTLELACTPLTVEGTLEGDTGIITQITNVGITGTYQGDASSLDLSGDWDNQGSFLSGASTITFLDQCLSTPSPTSTISGNNTFNVLQVSTTTSKTLIFESGTTQEITGDFIVNNPSAVTLQSSDPNTPAVITTTNPAVRAALQQVANSSSNPVTILGGAVKPIPTLSTWSALALIFLLMLGALRSGLLDRLHTLRY